MIACPNAKKTGNRKTRFFTGQKISPLPLHTASLELSRRPPLKSKKLTEKSILF
jgi:hypothetical protein